jgi:hypothetical protein
MAYQERGSVPPHFDGKNYQMWQRRMAAFLRGKGQILYYSLCQSEFKRVQTEDMACRIWEQLKNTHAGNAQVQARLFSTYRREYKNFTHLPVESIDAMFQRFMVIVNNMRANVAVLPYDEHDRAVKLLHSLDRTVWSGKVEAILESEKYETLTVDEVFSKLKSSEVDRGVRAKIENSTDPHSLALVSGSRTNANISSRHFSLSCLVSVPDEEFDVLGEEDLSLLSRRFERMYTNWRMLGGARACATDAGSTGTSSPSARKP